MSQHRITSTVAVLQACEDMLRKYGRVCCATVARELGYSRQNVYNVLERAYVRGLITEETYKLYKNHNRRRVSRTVKLSPESASFIDKLVSKTNASFSLVVESIIRQHKGAVQK